MKKNDWILAISVAVYSYLFYNQGLGINFLLFNICLIGLLSFRDSAVIKNRNWQFAAAGSIVSAMCIAIYGNGLSLIANLISLLILSALSFNPQTSVITSLCFSIYSIGASGVFMFLDWVERSRKKKNGGNQPPDGINAMLYIVPLGIAFVFFAMYKGSNPLFDDFTNKISINFDFIPGYLFFTIGGFFLLYGFFYHKSIGIIRNIDEKRPNTLNSENIIPNSILSVSKEKLSGLILFVMLNALLLTVNLLDVKFMWLGAALPEGLSYSELVHQGTGGLIASIIIAILIIMYYFRGALNFYKENKIIKLLAYAWIIQNIFMVISTAFRNQLYINEYSLTYLRIGVYVWLILAVIGLITTFIKIYKTKSNWYLLRTNTWLFYAVLVISCFINWDVMVTEFNINQAMKNNKALDESYLLSLSDRNLTQLLLLPDSVVVAEKYSEITINGKLQSFLKRMYDMDWQSWNYTDSRNYSEILKSYLKGDIKYLPLTNNAQYETSH